MHERVSSPNVGEGQLANMSEDRQPAFSDEAVRRFLLGSLNTTEQSRFEHSLFVDEALEERVRLTELELADDYTANRLSRADRDLFRQRFLLTADRERQLEVSRSLHRNFAASVSIDGPGFWQSAVGSFDVRRHAWKYAFATLALLLLLLGTALLIKKENSHLVNRDAPRVSPRPTATAAPQPAHHPTDSSAPRHNEASPALPLHEGLTTSLMLDSGTALESAPTISASGDLITVQLMLNEPLADSYEVNVANISGEPVFSAEGLKRTEDKTLGFDLPTSSIKPGDFRVTLTRLDGESKQTVGTYYFRVR
jgi:hypothetical protein